MPTTRAQREINFPVRKSRPTRTSSKAKLSVEDTENNPVVQKTPTKRKSKKETKAVTCSPPKRKKEQEVVRLSSKTPERLPLSPRKDDNVGLSFATANTQSPFKSPLRDTYLPPQKALLCSPRVARSLNFSPTKSALSSASTSKTPLTPKSNHPSPVKAGRALNFDAVDENNSSLVSHTTPSLFKNRTPRKCRRADATTTPQKASCQTPPKFLATTPTKMMSPPSGSPRQQIPTSPLRLVRQEGACYQKVKQVLHTALPERIVGRDDEYTVVNDFLDCNLKKKSSGSLYISGAPGTGKTAVLSHTIKRLKIEVHCKVVYINCMSFKNSQAIYNKVLTELKGKESSLSCKDALKELGKLTVGSGRQIVLILDEIDQLDSKNHDVLYTMFEWPSLPKSRLLLVGIANALDLTDRILPRLQAKPKCKPQLLHFSPYTKDQIVAVLQDRLEQVQIQGHQVLEPSAVQFCARKVSAVAGDMRKALDVCRRAVELVETDVKKQQILAGGPNSPSKRPVVPKKISVPHIMRIMNEVYGSRVAAQPGEKQTIPLQQKLIICTLLLMIQRGKSKEIALGKLHETYGKICKKQNVGGIDQSEFLSTCTLIEARGILGLKKAKDTRQTKVSLKLDERELESAMQDKTLISSVLKMGLS